MAEPLLELCPKCGTHFTPHRTMKVIRDQERQRLKEALFSELEGMGWSSDSDIPAYTIEAAFDRIIERAALDTLEADRG